MFVSAEQLGDLTTILTEVREDIERLKRGYENAVGEVKGAYKKVVLDKVWLAQRIVGQFYYASLATLTEIEKEFLDVSEKKDGTATLPQFEGTQSQEQSHPHPQPPQSQPQQLD